MSVCLADLGTGLAGAAAGAEIIGRDMVGVGVRRQSELAWRIQQLRITVIPITHPMGTAIMDMNRMRPHTVMLRLHMETLTLSPIAPDASVPTIRQARPIFRTAVSGFPAHSWASEKCCAL